MSGEGIAPGQVWETILNPGAYVAVVEEKGNRFLLANVTIDQQDAVAFDDPERTRWISEQLLRRYHRVTTHTVDLSSRKAKPARPPRPVPVPDLPRGACPLCGLEVTFNQDGSPRLHKCRAKPKDIAAYLEARESQTDTDTTEQ